MDPHPLAFVASQMSSLLRAYLDEYGVVRFFEAHPALTEIEELALPPLEFPTQVILGLPVD